MDNGHVCISKIASNSKTALFSIWIGIPWAGWMKAVVLCSFHAGMLSSEGRCKALDASADGYVRAEACGSLVLQALDGTADSQNVLALVSGTAVNQDGRSSSLTAPNGPSQQAVMKAALAAGQVAADQVRWNPINFY